MKAEKIPDRFKVKLTLDQDEASVLRVLAGKVGGHGPVRAVIQELWNRLSELDLPHNYEAFTGSITATDRSLASLFNNGGDM